MAEVQEYNPFLAPVSATIEAGQPDQSLGDKEYVVLPRRILCREKVVLPEICVFYGDTQGLEPRQRTLRSLKPFASFFLFVMTFLALPLSGFVFGASISWWSRGMIALALSCLISIVGLLIWRKGCNKVDATWYVSVLSATGCDGIQTGHSGGLLRGYWPAHCYSVGGMAIPNAFRCHHDQYAGRAETQMRRTP
jgi:hypothetical protein